MSLDRLIVAGVIAYGGYWYMSKDDNKKPIPQRVEYDRNSSVLSSQVFLEGQKNFEKAVNSNEFVEFAYKKSSVAKQLQMNYQSFLEDLVRGGMGNITEERDRLLGKAWIELYEIYLKQNPNFKLNDPKTYQGQDRYIGLLSKVFKMINSAYGDDTLRHYLQCAEGPKKPTQNDIVKLRNLKIQTLKPWHMKIKVEYHASKDNSNPRMEIIGLQWNRQGEFGCGG
jgi:hypothetical protein